MKKGQRGMMKGMEQTSFLDYELSTQKPTRRREFLRQMQELIPWNELEQKCISAGVYKANWGERARPSLPFRTLLGSLFLQAWYGLSDPQTEEQIVDSLSFREFLGIGFDGVVPDETTLCRFRNGLIRSGIMEEVFERVKAEVERRGWLLKSGQVVDATIVQTARPKEVRREEGQVEKNVYDAEAGYTKKRDRVYYGYKLHIVTDKRGWVCGVKTTSASVHDSGVVEELVDVDTGIKELYGDSGYMSRDREAWCRERGIEYKVVRRRVRGETELNKSARERNRAISKVRGVVELPFAILKRWMGYVRCRFRGLEKNGAYHFLLMAAYNLKRMYGELKREVETYA